MTLGNRLILLLTIPLLLVMILFGYLIQERSRLLLHEELLREGRAVTRVAQEAMEDYLRDHQVEDLRELANQLTGFERILGVRLYDLDGRLIHEPPGLDPATAPGAPELDAALAGTGTESQRRLGSTLAISHLLPLKDASGAPRGAMQVLQAETFIEEQARSLRRWVMSVTLIMIAAMALVVIIVARAGIDRPITELAQRFRAVGSGDLTAHASARRRDQFGALSREFERMVGQLAEARRSLVTEQEMRRRAEGSLRQAERLASVGRLAAGVAHEIGTPLNVIGGRAEALQRSLAGHEEAGRALGIIAAQIERISRIVRGLLDFARGSPARPAAIAPADAVRRVLDLLEHRITRAGVRVAMELPADLPRVFADADQLQQVLLNLATNALDAMPGGGTLAIRGGLARDLPAGAAAGPATAGAAGRIASRPGAGFVTLAVEDTGTGIAPEHQGRIFDPFFTTKDIGRGTGLGLSVAYGIVRDHGGAIEVRSTTGAGSRFTVYLPAVESAGAEAGAAPAAEDAPAAAPAAQTGGPRAAKGAA